jgi:hypothetical protein
MTILPEHFKQHLITCHGQAEAEEWMERLPAILASCAQSWQLTIYVPDLRKVLARRLDQLSEELAMDRARIRGWGLAQCMLSAWWHIEDGYQKPPCGVLACAEILSDMK